MLILFETWKPWECDNQVEKRTTMCVILEFTPSFYQRLSDSAKIQRGIGNSFMKY